MDDVDGGTCIVTSPTYSVVGLASFSIWYFHGQRDGGDDPLDGFLLELSTDDGSSFLPLVDIGDVTNIDVWTEVTAAIAPGSTGVVVRASATDDPGTTEQGDIVEAGLDDLLITSTASMTLVKSDPPANADEDGNGLVTEGDTLTYTLTATNTSASTALTGVSIADPTLGTLTCTQPVASLAAAAALVCTGTYVVSATDADNESITNIATASSTETADVTDTVITDVLIDTDDDGIPDNICSSTPIATQIIAGRTGGQIYYLNTGSGAATFATDSPFVSGFMNTLAANPDEGLVYYGSGTSVYYWDPDEGTGDASHHLITNLSGVGDFSGGNLESGSGAYPICAAVAGTGERLHKRTRRSWWRVWWLGRGGRRPRWYRRQ